MKQLINNYKNRIPYFDYLRILATFTVIIIHVSAQNWNSANVNSFNWNIYNIYDSISRWAVPIFVMISGTLFLEKNINIKKLYKNNILKLITIFIFWSLLYSLLNSIYYNYNFKTIIILFLKGHYHMWYIPMTIGLYIMTPFLKKLTETNKLIKYFLITSLLFTFIFPQIISITSIISTNISTALNIINLNFKTNSTIGYTSYFILGYYLNNKEFNKKQQHIIYFLGIISFITTILLTALLSIQLNKPTEIFYNPLTINILLESISIFIFFKYHFNKKYPIKLITKISNCCLGIYLIHPAIIFVLNKIFNLNVLSFNPILSIPIISLIVFIISLSISNILKSIPIIKKYLI